MKTCPLCNAVNHTDSKFCFSCGKPLAEGVLHTANPTTQSPNAQEQTIPSVQPIQPVQSQQSQQQQPFHPLQAQQPNTPLTYAPYNPSSSHPHNVGVGPGPNLPPYITPAKKSNSTWIIIASGIVAFAALIYLLIQFTSIGNTVMGWFGADKSQQLIDYYNDQHLPIFVQELSITEEMDALLLYNSSPNLDYIYQTAPTWKNGFSQVKVSYSNAEIANSEIKEVNDFSIQRTIQMEYAIGRLITAIEQDSPDIYNNDFVPSVVQYYELLNQWQTKMDILFEKYGLILQ